MATWNSRGLRGSGLEEYINQTNEVYRDNQLALVQKIPTPITPINIDKTNRHITLAYFDQKSTVSAWSRGFRSALTPRSAREIPFRWPISMSIRLPS